MRDVLDDVERWRAEGRAVALGTVAATWGSAPRGVGAKLALTADGGLSGSVSGGCVEAAVVEAGRDVLASGSPRLLEFGVSDDAAWQVGLSCGGRIEVYVERLDEDLYDALRSALSGEHPVALATVLGGPGAGGKLLVRAGADPLGDLGAGLREPVAAAAREALTAGRPRRLELAAEGAAPCDVLVEVHMPSPTLVVVGGVHIAVALTALARELGYRTIVVDPRRAFGSAERFPHADRLVQAWPDAALERIGLNESTAIAVLTHDPKLDDPALRAALPSRAFYVGALGSRATQARRRERLLEAGLDEAQLSRLHAPIGLDLGGRAPQEIALSVMAQIVAVRNGTGRSRGGA